MRSEKYHSKTEKTCPIVVNEASRLSIQATDQIVSIYQVDDNGKKCGVLGIVNPGSNQKYKLNNVNEILLESKGDFNSVIEGPDELDKTPIEVPVERPMTQTQQIKMWLQNEENVKVNARTQLTWEEFTDLGELDDGDEFYKRFGQEGMTKYEMQAEAMRQEMNPLRGNPVTEAENARLNNDDIGGKNNAEVTKTETSETKEIQGQDPTSSESP